MIRFSVLRERIIECVTELLRQRLRPAKDMVVSLIQLELAYINTNHPDFIGGSRAIAELMSRMQQQAAEQQAAAAAAHDGSSAKPDNPPTDRTPQLRQQHEPPTQGMLAGEPITASFSSQANSQQGTAIRGLRLPQIPRAVRLQGADSADISDRAKVEVEIIKSLVHSYYSIVRKNFVDLVPKAVMALLVNHAKNNVQSELVRHLYREELFDDLLRETDDVTKRRRHALEMQALLQRASEILNEVRDYKV